ncbi:M14 family metallopeptidase [Pleomorphovibrio marinus]|uniref:M14 family metallopeptidase n=1 Tax=Pleomorphovibrio marinus TaxID=2164132 RepID=UPI000E0B24E3|nr:M14 family metallopeptidase [Pleomorphovibrio marinus]
MNRIYCLILAVCIAAPSWAQTQSPKEFLGYELGERFTPHHRVIAYFEHVAANNSNVSLEPYGESVERRPLMVAYVSDQSNMDQLEKIREDNLIRTGIKTGSTTTQVPVTWLSYNVHGNEAVSSESAMMTLYALVDPAEADNKAWLKNNLVVIDPCLNPDGQERYVNWYNQKVNDILQPDPQSVEHREPWPGGRPNHYLFDLNRDWAWQIQKESQQRAKIYQSWMPHVHLDFHEQGLNEPYYFAPAAEPLHRQLSDYQHEFQEIFGRNTAKYFDENDWFYFTKERFDLLYPSYGDTYPMYNGAIGMTIEQGGSGRAGLGILNAEGDTVTLKDRIIHHHTTALSAIEVTSSEAERVLSEFEKYFSESSQNPKGKYKSFIIKADNEPAKMQKLLELLDKNGISYGRSGGSRSLQGLNYHTGKNERFDIQEEDLVVNAYQPRSILAQVLFEPEPILNDSITYDITTWALPYAYNLKAYAVESRVDAGADYESEAFSGNTPDASVLAYLAPWHSVQHAAYLSALVREGIRVRYATFPFRFGDTEYPAGTLIIPRGGNQYVADFHEKVTDIANRHQITLSKTQTAYVDSGKDFGSSDVRAISKPKVALIGGNGTSSLNFGEIWHFLEQELRYPVSILEMEYLGAADLSSYDVILLPSTYGGSWEETLTGKLLEWVKQGGKLIAYENSLNQLVDQGGLSLTAYLDEEEKENATKLKREVEIDQLTVPYQEREREAISDYIGGAVVEVDMDVTHPLAFGIGDKFYSLKNNDNRFALLKNGVNVGHIPSADRHRAGFIGYRFKPQLERSMVFGVEALGRGQVVYFADNPMFRSFWESGKMLVANALFLVGQ